MYKKNGLRSVTSIITQFGLFLAQFPFKINIHVKIIIFMSPNDTQVTHGKAIITGHLPSVGSCLPDLAEIKLKS
jgi:hypothetical protein